MKKRFLVFVLAIAVVVSCFAACNVKKYKVSYETDGNGTISGQAVQTLKTGEQTTIVTAVENAGYKFLRWSDDNTSITRTDVVANEDLTFTAYFEKRKYDVKYSVFADVGGIIAGDTYQIIEYGGNSAAVRAVPATGYKFVKWWDTGSTNPVRKDTNVSRHIHATAVFERESYDKYTLSYLTDGNGTIEGQATQQVYKGDDAAQVKAIANENYEFVKWSDGVTTAERQDLCITESKTVTAEFKCICATFKLDYKLGEADTDVTEFTFTDADFKTVKFPVPVRELFTFNGWFIGDKQVTDENGTMLVGKEILQSAEREIYAKWTANETYTYKILMVYVTELDAVIPSIRGNGDFDVYYKMSDFDIEICKTITEQVRRYLNDLLDGLVNFEVDEYFTTAPVGSESISNGNVVNYIDAYEIPEIFNSGIQKEYQSVLTVFCMDDYGYEFRTAAGVAGSKYGTVYLESVYGASIINKEPLEYLLDLNFWRWRDIIVTFFHELAHTIEDQFHGYDYHSIISWVHSNLTYDDFIMNKLYYLNMIEIDGEKVGIPLDFWKGDLELFLPDDG